MRELYAVLANGIADLRQARKSCIRPTPRYVLDGVA
jgi:hypothetical protein